MPEPLWSGLAHAPSRELFTQLTGQTARKMLESCDTATAGRLSLLSLAPVITAYEYAMTEGEGRNTWRSDGRHSPCPRGAAGAYLAFLAGLGYRLSLIEQALVDDVPYVGETLPDEQAGFPVALSTSSRTTESSCSPWPATWTQCRGSCCTRSTATTITAS
jgi:hypothetical protein